MRSVTLGGPELRKSRPYFSDPNVGADAWLERDVSVASMLDQELLKAVLDALAGIARHGVCLSGCIQLGAQWDRVLGARAFGPGESGTSAWWRCP